MALVSLLNGPLIGSIEYQMVAAELNVGEQFLMLSAHAQLQIATKLRTMKNHGFLPAGIYFYYSY